MSKWILKSDRLWSLYLLLVFMCAVAMDVQAEVQRFTGKSQSTSSKSQDSSAQKNSTRNQFNPKCDNYQRELNYYTSLAKQGRTSDQGSYYRKKRREYKKKLWNQCKD